MIRYAVLSLVLAGATVPAHAADHYRPRPKPAPGKTVTVSPSAASDARARADAEADADAAAKAIAAQRQSQSADTSAVSAQSLDFAPVTRVDAEPKFPVATADAPRGPGGSFQFPDAGASLRPPDRFGRYLDLARFYDDALGRARAEYLRATQSLAAVRKGSTYDAVDMQPYLLEIERLTALRDGALEDARAVNDRGCHRVNRALSAVPIVGFMIGNGC